MNLRARLLLHCELEGLDVEKVLPIIKLVLDDLQDRLHKWDDWDYYDICREMDNTGKEIESCRLLGSFTRRMGKD